MRLLHDLRAAGAVLLLLLAVEAGACSHTGEGPCSLAVIPVTDRLESDSLENAALRIGTDCPVLTAATIRQRIPPHLRSLNRKGGAAAVEALLAAYHRYTHEDLDVGRRELLAAWARLRPRPEYLPREPARRRQVYHALLAVVRILGDGGTVDSEALEDWLALHLSDQLPSLKQLPPLLAARLTTRVEAARQNEILVSAPAPRACASDHGRLCMDGRVLGGLPVVRKPLPAGRHAMHVECGAVASWVRMVDFAADIELRAPDVALESDVLVSRHGIAVVPGFTLDVELLAARLGATFHADAVLLVPVDDGAPRLVVNGDVWELPVAAAGAPLEVPVRHRVAAARHDWKVPAAWVSAGLFAVALSTGVAANVLYNRRIDSMAGGTTDRRGEAAVYRDVAIGGYAAAGVAFTSAATLFVLHALPREHARSIFGEESNE